MDTALESQKIAIDNRRWRVRRRFAYFSAINLTAILLFIFGFSFFSDEQTIKAVTQFNSVLIALIGLHSSIIGVYIGSASFTNQKM